jgi:hypothetical protein
MQSADIRITHVAATDDPDVIFAALLAEGAVIIEGFLTADQLARINNDLEPANAAADPLMQNVRDFDFGLGFEMMPDDDDVLAAAPSEPAAAPSNTRNVTGLTSKLPTFAQDVLLHPTYKSLCDRLLLPHCHDYVLNHSHMINVGPGHPAQPIHRDEVVFMDVPGLGPGSHLMFASVIALVDFTQENGATNIAPGSHLWEGDAFGVAGRSPQPEDIGYAQMPAGSAVVYLGWTFHGAGHNQTADTWRRGLHVSFCQGWLRTEENNTLATPPDIARALPLRAQQLLGYGIHRGTGMVELRSPIDQMAAGII